MLGKHRGSHGRIGVHKGFVVSDQVRPMADAEEDGTGFLIEGWVVTLRRVKGLRVVTDDFEFPSEPFPPRVVERVSLLTLWLALFLSQLILRRSWATLIRVLPLHQNTAYSII